MRLIAEQPQIGQLGQVGTLKALADAVGRLFAGISSLLADAGFRVNRVLPKDGTEAMTAPLPLKSFTVATLPAVGTGELIFVSDETGGSVPAFSDGTNWRRATDRAIVS